MKEYKIVKDINPNIFRGYDIRAVYGTDITEDVAYTIGKSFGSYIQEQGNKKCVVGHDNRGSSEPLSEALISGITSTGVDVYDIGLVTTPMYYFAQVNLNDKSEIMPGIMITASHNPKEYNGFKMAFNSFGNACGQMIQDFRVYTEKCEFVTGEGQVEKVSIKDGYLNLVKGSISLGDRKIKVVVDTANGTASVIAKEVFDLFKDNIEMIPLYMESNPDFPHHHPDPSVESNNEDLKKAVLDNNADLGIGIDGDGDRVGVIDEKGQMVFGDFYAIIILRDIMSKVSNKCAIFDIKCSKSLDDEIVKLGGTPIRYRTGNSYIKCRVREENIPFGSELSGHIFFNDRWPNIDDGLYAGLRLVEILSKTDKNVSDLLEGVNKYYSTPDIKIKSTDEEKFKVVEKIKDYCRSQEYKVNDIDGVRVEFETGSALVRASNTEPLVTARFEAITKEEMLRIKEEFMNLLKL